MVLSGFSFPARSNTERWWFQAVFDQATGDLPPED